jgi:HPt (histidine-containing phosphotransfer) domain-containing protein
LDGLDTTRRIRETEKAEGRRIPIVAITADVGIETRKACFDAGMDGFLGKPMNVDELRAVLHEYLDQGAPGEQKPHSSPSEVSRRDTRIQRSSTPLAFPADSAHSLLDTDVIEEILALQRSDKPDLLEKVTTLYLEGAADLIDRMKRGAVESNFEAIRAAAHSLKSSSAHIGAHTISAHAKDLEALSKKNSKDGIEALLKSIDSDFSLVSSELRSLITERTA